jgi:HK97 family phage major capsid protein
MSTIKALREERYKIVVDARAILDSGNGSAESTAKFDALMIEADNVKAKIDRLEKLEDSERSLGERTGISARLRNILPEQVREEDADQKRAFGAYLRNGITGLNDDDRRVMNSRFKAAQSIGTGSGGGYTIPQGFYDDLIGAEKAFGGMIEASFILDTATGNALPIPTDNDTGNTGAIIAENTMVSEVDVTFGQITLNAYTYTSNIVRVSNQLLQDSAFDLDAWLAKQFGTRIGRIVNTHMTVGTGGGAMPTGVVPASTAGQTGVTGETTSLIYDDLILLEHSVDPAYRKNAIFMMADSTLAAIKRLKDTIGRPLWLPGLAADDPDTINSHKFVINQDMPVMAANAKSILFGDFSNYFIRRVAGAQVLRLTERYADYNQVGFVAFQRFDGNLINAGTNPIKQFVNSAT